MIEEAWGYPLNTIGAPLIRSINSKAIKSQRTARVRVATYNLHKCRGLDGRVRPSRIVKVLSEINADIVALQEVVCLEGKAREDHQARYIAAELGYHVELGKNRQHKGGAYGNVLLSRFPIYHARNYDISIRGRERRGCLRADVRLEDGGWLHIFNLHLGTSFFERRKQARKLFGQQILTDRGLPGNKIILGDFNEWTRGLASRLLGLHFRNAGRHPRLSSRGTYPGVFPLLNLDHVYFDQTLKLAGFSVHRSRTALIASDHLPLIAELLIRDVDVNPDPNEQRIVSKAIVESPSNSLSAASLRLFEI